MNWLAVLLAGKRSGLDLMQAKKAISRTLFPKMRSDAGEESRGCCEEDSYQVVIPTVWQETSAWFETKEVYIWCWDEFCKY